MRTVPQSRHSRRATGLVRGGLTRRGAGDGESFRWRTSEITRVEGFSDAVFAFAITLLVVSPEVPKTVHELPDSMRGFAAFLSGMTYVSIGPVLTVHGMWVSRRRKSLAQTVPQ